MSLYFFNYAIHLPSFKTSTVKLANYSHNSVYEYTASLQPNIIFNKTVLKTGEGPIYTGILRYLNLTMNYNFLSSHPPSNLSISQETLVYLSSKKWNRTLDNEEAQKLFKMGHSSGLSMQINHTSIMTLLKAIDKETGVYSNSYTIRLVPIIRVKAAINGGQIDDTFVPEINIIFNTGSESGNFISIENLQQTRFGTITNITQVNLPWVETQRIFSYILLTLSTTGLLSTIYIYARENSKKPKTDYVKKIVKRYKGLITESSVNIPPTENNVNFDSIEDLVKTAEIIAKPIIHSKQEGEDIFYIIDNNTKYLHRLEGKNKKD